MEAEKKKVKEPTSGMSIKHVLVPAAIILLFMHTFIVVNTIRINRMGQRISATTQRSFSYSQTAKEFESESETLADKARLYVNTGAIQYLNDYVRETERITQKDNASREIMMGSISEGARAEIEAAIDMSIERAEMEKRAMRLRAESLHADLSRYPDIANATLSAEEAALSTSAAKRQTAEELLVSAQYLQIRSMVHDHIDAAVRIVSQEAAAQIGALSGVLRSYQTLQWAITGGIILLIGIVAMLVIYLLVMPLERGVEHVHKGDQLPVDLGVSEYRDLAGAYNELLHHRRMMESYLRKQTQTDALTGLPNRLAFQNHITELSWNQAHSSVIAFSLDVNGLKEANDTKGHAFGDTLLCAAAEAIRAAFGEGDGRECFRFGGDEFAAFWVNVPLGEIEVALERFRQEQAERRISVSVGYAYIKDMSEITVEELFEQADKAMYEDKAKHHKRIASAESDQQRMWQDS